MEGNRGRDLNRNKTKPIKIDEEAFTVEKFLKLCKRHGLNINSQTKEQLEELKKKFPQLGDHLGKGESNGESKV